MSESIESIIVSRVAQAVRLAARYARKKVLRQFREVSSGITILAKRRMRPEIVTVFLFGRRIEADYILQLAS